MARHEQDREDLLGQAKALVERIELRAPGADGQDREAVVVGFRANSAASVYFGTEPAYHFNASGELRRAFANGRLYKAEHRKLVQMVRQRTETQTELAASALDPDQQRAFLRSMSGRLAGLHRALMAGRCEIVGQVPPESAVIERVQAWLHAQTLDEPSVALRPHVE